MLKKLSLVVAQLPQFDLPAAIKAIYVFGGILREKERLHDVDVICLFSQTSEQSQRWARFCDNFSGIKPDSKSSSLRKLRPLLDPYYEKRIPLAQAVKEKQLSQALEARGVEPAWAGCFSWTELLHNPLGFFHPSIETVLRKLTFKASKGLSIIFVPVGDFESGRSGYSHLNSVLAWSLERPDIDANLSQRTVEERKQFLLQELRKFCDILCETKERYAELKSKLARGPAQLNFEALERGHAEIRWSGECSYSDLLAECERARSEMRSYDEEVAVLGTIQSVILGLQEREPVLENPVEEQVAWLTLLWQPKYLVNEIRIRELLRILGLPEERVETVKHRGRKTEYELSNMRFRSQ
ncbi:MAG: hypothetical protein V1737_01635 [Chloroflexota bacterium]